MYQTGPRIGSLAVFLCWLWNCASLVSIECPFIVAHCPIVKHQSSQRALDIHSWWLSQLFTIHHMMSHDFRVHRTSSWLANVSYLASWTDFMASSSRIPTPAMACRNPGPQPCRIPQQKHSRRTKVDTKQFEFFVDFVYDVDVVFWFHVISFFQMFPDVQFLLWKIKKSTPSDWGWPHRARAEHCRHRSCWSPMCHVHPCGEISWDFPDQPIWNIIDVPQILYLEYYMGYYHLLFGISYSNWDIFSMSHRFQVEYLWYPIYLEYYCIYLRISNIVEYIWISKIFGIL